ncbi:hypothetical protein Sru01_09790 [Sphaerisporangium rufum]|uniref:2-methylcitrate dehydratase PrpD n=1 Tax=Sphaerisporangium rufum TaxID=1381558 RepID=A0A919R2U9_9ACTN|nr:MmgE/PrpD family protein [Sphaerisporangium rufum]GII75997.1 hypothetical protein Sru01_09790 [Sphaerisporangium rufum]
MTATDRPGAATAAEEYVAGLLAATTPPERVRARTAAVVADTVAVARLAAGNPDIAGMLDAAAPGPSSTVVPGRPAAPEIAAGVNATAAVYHELDEGLRGAGHPGAHVVPAAVAVAEAEGAPASEVLHAVALGYQLQADLGRAVTLRPEVHAHGALGAPAAALAAARVLRLDAARVAQAVLIAANLAPAGDWSACTGGHTVRHLFAGQGAQTGVRAAYLARAGFTAPAGSLDVAYGIVRGDGGPPRLRRGGGWAVTQGYLKLWSACAYTHSALDALAGARARSPFTAAEVGHIVVRVPAAGLLVGGVHTRTPLAARFSIPVVLATLVVHGELNGVIDRARVDSAVLALAGRITVRHDPEMDREWPARMPAAVHIALRDGTTVRERVEDPAGPAGAEYPGAVRDKIRRLGTGDELIGWMAATAPGSPDPGVQGLFTAAMPAPGAEPPAARGPAVTDVTGGDAHGRSTT